jgi:hypothetical protein
MSESVTDVSAARRRIARHAPRNPAIEANPTLRRTAVAAPSASVSRLHGFGLIALDIA